MMPSSAAHAQAPAQASSDASSPRSPAAAKAADKSKGPRRPQGATTGGKKSISIDEEILVEGKLEKPSAFYVLRRSSTDYDWARLDATMTPLVLESVWDPLF